MSKPIDDYAPPDPYEPTLRALRAGANGTFENRYKERAWVSCLPARRGNRAEHREPSAAPDDGRTRVVQSS